MTADSGRPDDLVARAHELIPFLRSHSERSERECTLAPEVVTTLRDAGFFRLTTPAKYGGHDLSLPAQAEVIAAVSRGCASAGWVVAAEAASTMFALLLPETGVADAFDGRPDSLVLSSAADLTTSVATRTEGGFLLSGHCRFATGAEISDWALVLAIPVKDGDEDGPLLSCLVPLSDVTVERTWQVAGMGGTGTQSFVFDDVFVPAERVREYRFSEVLVDEDQRASFFVRASLTTLAALVGAAQGALDVVREMLSKDMAVSLTAYQSAVESPAVRLWFAEATHLVDSSALHLMHAAGRLDGIGYEEPVPWVERAALRMHASSSVRLARDAVEKLLDIGGTRGFALANPLQRFWRDLAVGSRHASFHAPTTLEDYSLALWGRRPSPIHVT